MIRHASLHTWDHSQAIMDMLKVVIHVMQGDNVYMVLQFCDEVMSNTSTVPHGFAVCVA